MWEDMYNGTIYEDEDRAREVAKEEMNLDDYLEFGDFSCGRLIELVLKYCPDEIFDEIDAIVRQNCPEIYVPKYYVKRDEIPVTEVNKKIDFKTLSYLID